MYTNYDDDDNYYDKNQHTPSCSTACDDVLGWDLLTAWRYRSRGWGLYDI